MPSLNNSNQLNFPTKMCLFAEENLLFVSDSGNNRILAVDTSTKRVRFTIGSGRCGHRDGRIDEAEFDWPQGLAIDARTHTLYVADTFNDLIRAVDLRTRQVSRVAGVPSKSNSSLRRIGEYDYAGGRHALEQSISSPWDVCLVEDASSKLLMIACAGTHQIWLYVISSGEQAYVNWWKSTPKIERNSLVCVAGNGKERNRNNSYPMQASFAQPSGLCLSSQNDSLYVADAESSTIRVVTLKDGSVKAVAGGDSSQPDNLFAYGDTDGIGKQLIYSSKTKFKLAIHELI